MKTIFFIYPIVTLPSIMIHRHILANDIYIEQASKRKKHIIKGIQRTALPDTADASVTDIFNQNTTIWRLDFLQIL